MGRKKGEKKKEPATSTSSHRKNKGKEEAVSKDRVRHLLRLSSEDVPAAAAALGSDSHEIQYQYGDEYGDDAMFHAMRGDAHHYQESIATYRPGSQRGRENISESELSRLMTDQWTFTEMVTFFKKVRWTPELLQTAENALFQRVRAHRWEEDSSVLVYQDLNALCGLLEFREGRLLMSPGMIASIFKNELLAGRYFERCLVLIDYALQALDYSLSREGESGMLRSAIVSWTRRQLPTVNANHYPHPSLQQYVRVTASLRWWDDRYVTLLEDPAVRPLRKSLDWVVRVSCHHICRGGELLCMLYELDHEFFFLGPEAEAERARLEEEAARARAQLQAPEGDTSGTSPGRRKSTFRSFLSRLVRPTQSVPPTPAAVEQPTGPVDHTQPRASFVKKPLHPMLALLFTQALIDTVYQATPEEVLLGLFPPKELQLRKQKPLAKQMHELYSNTARQLQNQVLNEWARRLGHLHWDQVTKDKRGMAAMMEAAAAGMGGDADVSIAAAIEAAAAAETGPASKHRGGGAPSDGGMSLREVNRANHVAREHDRKTFDPREREFISTGGQRRLGSWMRQLHAQILERLMDRVQRNSASNTQLSFLDREAEQPGSVRLTDLLHSNPLAWPVFSVWHYHFLRAGKPEDNASESALASMQRYAALMQGCLQDFTASLNDSTISVETVEYIAGTQATMLVPALALTNQESAFEVVCRLREDNKAAREMLERLTKAMKLYFADADDSMATVQFALSRWRSLPIYELQHLLNQPLAAPLPKGRRYETSPLPAELLESVDWLLFLEKSQLFRRVWDSQPAGGIARLLDASLAWAAFDSALRAGKTTFAVLERFSDLLVKPDEVRLLFSSAARSVFEPQSKRFQWVVAETTSRVDSTVEAIKRWRHLECVYKNHERVVATLQAVLPWVQPKGHASLQRIVDQVRELAALFEKVGWVEQTLGRSAEFEKISQRIAPVLATVDTELYLLAQRSGELFEWLRTMPHDTEFSNTIEMAIGKSEMECPFELWQEEPGRPGRPDEEKLSMLSTVRAYLHPHIYRERPLYRDFDDIMSTFLLRLGKYEDGFLGSLTTCNRFLGPLRQLLADDHSAAPSRLVQLQAPVWNAEWVVSNRAADLSVAGVAEADHSDRGNWVWLQWSVTHESGERSFKRQNANELLDFQSTVVLSQAGSYSPEVQAAVDRFVQQFGWARQLSEAACTLHQAAHFEYQTFAYRFPFVCDPHEMRAAVVATREVQQEWSTAIDRQGREHYFLNFFNMRQVWRMVQLLNDGLLPNPQVGVPFATDLLALVSWAHAQDRQNVAAFVQRLQSAWDRERILLPESSRLQRSAKLAAALAVATMSLGATPDAEESDEESDEEAGDQPVDLRSARANLKVSWDSLRVSGMRDRDEDEEEDEEESAERATAAVQQHAAERSAEVARGASPSSAARILAACGAALQSALSPVPAPHRPITSESEATDYVSTSISKKAVYVLVADSRAGVFSHAALTYLKLGYLPERQELLLCRASTSWEDVQRFVYRWSHAHEHGRGQRVFTLLSLEELSYEVQQRAVMLIRDQLSTAQQALLLISATENQHMVSQFNNHRITAHLPPRSALSVLGNALEQSSGASVKSYMSNHAGAGKTFEIRRAAYGERANYVHFPVYSTKSFVRRLVELRDSLPQDWASHVHFDLLDTVQDDFNSYLFELSFLGGISDSHMADAFLWDPTQVSLAFEVSSGPLIARLPTASLLTTVPVQVSEATFCSSAQILRMCMREDYGSWRFDGTAARKLQDGQRTANAFQRLQYVCLALNVLEENAGRFPHIYEGPNVSPLESLRLSQSVEEDTATEELAGDVCFRRLMDSSRLDEQQPSLWCLWNYVNVLYWQLRDMHYEDSPINAACMPDLAAERSDHEIAKERFKGEIINFLMSTAREFATRQTKITDHQQIVGVRVQGMTRYQWNGLWERMQYDNDGRPCFKHNTFYLYFRRSVNHWVIDDVIEPTGAVFSESKGAEIDKGWTTSPSWAVNTAVRVEKVKDPEAFKGEALKITGMNADENGTYLLQPTYDNIDGRPHYIKTTGKRRHLFWSARENCWQVCPVCNADEGAFALSTNETFNRWRTMPPDIEEKSCTFEYLRGVPKWIKYPVPEPKASPDKPAAAAAPSGPSSTVATGEKTVEMTEEERSILADLSHLQTMFDNTLAWNESNHETLLFSNVSHTISFLSLNPTLMRDKMHPNLLSFLKTNQFNVGEDLDALTTRHHEILSGLTDVSRSRDEALGLLDGSYCLTGDSLIKMLAVYVRIRCGVPVILMGECGCGKTMLIRYLCAWLNVRLIILDVHGGTMEQDVVDVMENAEAEVRAREAEGDPQPRAYVFLDEVNTCPHMGLMTEVICHRSIYGRKLHPGVMVLAALNPYRQRPSRGEASGLVFSLAKETTPDPMSQLVYRVHPIPHTLRDFVFDFGSLEESKEKLYIKSMTARSLDLAVAAVYAEEKQNKDRPSLVVRHIAASIYAAQRHVRDIEGDPSVVSLRDVKRCLHLINWFWEHAGGADRTAAERKSKKKKGNQKKPDADADENVLEPRLVRATLLGVAFVYYYRLDTEAARAGLWTHVYHAGGTEWTGRQLRNTAWSRFTDAIELQVGVTALERRFCRNVEVEDGIALNAALRENLFVSIVSILNRIPIFLVGKPGTSKTLTMQVIASNLQGKQSPNEFWRRYPSVHIFPYQCSPMSDSHSIQHQFDMAVRYQKHAGDALTVLLLDEVGLAEHSPEMPLKVLHGMLVEPAISIVGLSNWVLDPAKMNRALCLQRPDPSVDDIHKTGFSIMSLDDEGKQALSSFLQPLTQVFHDVYNHQVGRDFIGMRDYYSLIKLLRSELPRHIERLGRAGAFAKFLDLLVYAVCRNFGGKPETFRKVLASFLEKFDKSRHPVPTPVTKLIADNLVSSESRHLMLLTKNGAALQLLFGGGILDPCRTTVLVGSGFEDDQTELHLVKQINEVKLAMLRGDTCVLVNHDNIYEALYDVLNQRYLFKTDRQTGKVKKMLRLAIGSRSQLCQVQPGFKMVVVVEQEHAYQRLDLPLLNRFEKQVLCATDLLGQHQWDVVEQLREWCQAVVEEVGFDSYQSVFCGYHPSTVPSAVLAASEFKDERATAECVAQVKRWLASVCTPIAIMHSALLREAVGSKAGELGWQSGDFAEATRAHVLSSPNERGALAVMLTHSPISHLAIALDYLERDDVDSLPVELRVVQLAAIPSEGILVRTVDEYLRQEVQRDHLLVIECDVLTCPQFLVNHSQYLVSRQQLEVFEGENKRAPTPHKLHILFLVHMPPGVARRARDYALDFNAPWSYVFVDDLRPELADSKFTTKDWVNNSAAQLARMGAFQLDELVHDSVQAALAECIVPSSVAVDDACSYVNRVRQFRAALQNADFRTRITNSVMDILAEHEGADSNDMHLHVLLASTQVAGGSFRQSLRLSVRLLIKQALAATLRYLDRDFNLVTFERSPALWLALYDSRSVFDPQRIAATARLGAYSGLSSVGAQATVLNHGRHGPLVSQFPWSVQVIELLNAGETRATLERAASTGSGRPEQVYEQLANTCTVIYGEEATSLWRQFCAQFPDAYLHDYMSVCTSSYPGLSFEQQCAVYGLVLSAAHPQAFADPAYVHVAVWQNQERLHRICSVCSQLGAKKGALLIKALQRLVQAKPAEQRNAALLSQLDACVVETVCELVWLNAASVLASSSRRKVQARWRSLDNTIMRARVDLEALLLSLDEQRPADQPLKSSALHMRWTSVLLLRLWISEVATPFRVLGEFWQPLVAHLRHPHVADASYLVEMLPLLGTVMAALGEQLPDWLTGAQVQRVLPNTSRSVLSLFSGAGGLLGPGWEKHRAIELLLREPTLRGLITQHVAQFLRRYISEVLFGGLSGLYTPVAYRALSPELSLLLLEVTANQFQPLRDTLPDSATLALRRTAFQCVLDADMLLLEQPLNPVVAQLYVEHQLGVITAALHSGQEVPPLSVEESGAILLGWEQIAAAPPASRLLTLRQLARCMARIRWFVNRLLFTDTSSAAAGDEPESAADASSTKGKGKGRAKGRAKVRGKDKEDKDKEDKDKKKPAAASASDEQPKLLSKEEQEARAAERRAAAARQLEAQAQLCKLPEDLRDVLSPEAVTPSGEPTAARFYAAKLLLQLGGLDSLYELTLGPLGAELPWLPLAGKVAEYERSRPMDALPIFFDHGLLTEHGKPVDFYQEVCTAVRKSASGSQTHVSELRRRYPLYQLRPFAVPAVLNEVYFPATENVLRQHDHFVNELLEKSDVERRFAQSVVYGRWTAEFMPQLPLPQHQLFTQISSTMIFLAAEHRSWASRDSNKRVAGTPDGSGSLWIALFEHPKVLLRHMIPSMPESEYATIATLLQNPGWYKCPNGHLYTVGNCTRPMEVSTCPDCGAQIGGRNHENVAGVRRVDVVTEAEQGYTLRRESDGSEAEEKESSTLRSAPITIRMMRFLLHLALRISMHLGREDQVLELLGKPFHANSVRSLGRRLDTTITDDWMKLRKLTTLGDADLTVAVHLVLAKAGVAFASNAVAGGGVNRWTAPQLSSSQGRRLLEGELDAAVAKVFGTAAQTEKLLEQTRRSGIVGLRTRALVQSYSDAFFVRLDESDGKASKLASLWRYAEVVSFEGFVEAFRRDPVHQERFPVLAAFLRVEERLPLLHFLPAILEWHALLFEAVPPQSLSRDEAGDITNRQLIEQRLPQEKRAHAYEVFARFADGFNKALPLLENLYECQANPFLSSDKLRVDLSGRGLSGDACLPMSLDIPIRFSLPSFIRGGENDAPGLCTVKLLQLMQQSYNEVLEEINAPPKPPPKSDEQLAAEAVAAPDAAEAQPDTTAPALPAAAAPPASKPRTPAEKAEAEHLRALAEQRRKAKPSAEAKPSDEAAAEPTTAAAAADDEDDALSAVPPLSYQTSAGVLRQRAIAYDRQRDLMPLVHMSSEQGLEYGSGGQQRYSFELVENGLRANLLAAREPVLVQIHHFQFRGELKQAGRISGLRQRVAQQELSPTVLEQITDELSTQGQASMLASRLEIAIGFLASVGSDRVKGAQGQTLLSQYMLGTLMLDPSDWAASTTRTVEASVRLCHLQALYLHLEEIMHGSPLDNVHHKYRESLTPELDEQLNKAAAEMLLPVLLPVLRDFLLDQLVEGKWDENASLKEWLGYCDPEIPEADWYDENFPDLLQLKHSLSTFQLLQGLVGKI